MKRWWGPKAFTTPVAEIDLRLGGKSFSCLRSPEGKDYCGTGVYREIIKPRRLVVTDSFADEKGNVVPASHYGMSKDWPVELLITVTFEEQDSKTKLTLKHGNIAGVPAADFDGMKQGWNESFDKLAEHLEKERSTPNFNSIMIGSTQPKVLAEYYEKIFGRATDWAEDNWYGWQIGNTHLTIGRYPEVGGKPKEPERIILNLNRKMLKEHLKGLKAGNESNKGTLRNRQRLDSRLRRS